MRMRSMGYANFNFSAEFAFKNNVLFADVIEWIL